MREKGIRNQRAYLTADHLDVYVATSMRQRHEYLEVAEFAKQVSANDQIRSLKLRWFDPTQAYCSDRIDKGVAEALMLNERSAPFTWRRNSILSAKIPNSHQPWHRESL